MTWGRCLFSFPENPTWVSLSSTLPDWVVLLFFAPPIFLLNCIIPRVMLNYLKVTVVLCKRLVNIRLNHQEKLLKLNVIYKPPRRSRVVNIE